ncbi:MAG TPA: hypothetical protein V6D50_25675 [Chroococcales cyanobacterium]
MQAARVDGTIAQSWSIQKRSLKARPCQSTIGMSCTQGNLIDHYIN